VDVDGKWGPQSTDAAFGMSADEAWEIYELETTPEPEPVTWEPKTPKVETTPLWEESKPKKETTTSAQGGLSPSVSPAASPEKETPKATPAISDPVEGVDYFEGWEDDEPITKPTEVWDDDYDWTKDEEPEPAQPPKTRMTAEAAPTVKPEEKPVEYPTPRGNGFGSQGGSFTHHTTSPLGRKRKASSLLG